MTIIVLRILYKYRLYFTEYNFICLFLILIAMLKPLSATPQVSAEFTTMSANNGCGTLVVEFQDLSTGNPDTWLWDFGNGIISVQQNPVIFFSTPGIYDIKLTVSNSSSNNTIIKNGLINVFEKPISSFSVNLSNGCLPLEIQFDDISISSAPITSWLWDFGDGGNSIQQNPNYTYNNSGVFSVTLSIIDSNNCQSIIYEDSIINVEESIIAYFDSDLIFSCDTIETVNFTNLSTNATNYAWDFGDGTTSLIENPSHVFNSGIYTVSLYASSNNNNCIDTLVLTDLITIGLSPIPSFNANITSGCEDLFVEFIDNSSGATDWFWDFGDGITSSLINPTHIYSDPGIYDVTLTTSYLGGCSSSQTYSSYIEVFPIPNIDFSADTLYSCDTPFVVQFFDDTYGAVSWYWDFGDGTTDNVIDPIKVYSDFGLFNITLRAMNSYGCSSIETISNMITLDMIIPDILPIYSAGCAPVPINFIDTSLSIRPLVYWFWDFGDGTNSTVQNPTHEYINSGIYDVSLEIMNDYGCVSFKQFNNIIRIDDPPIVNINVNINSACVNEDISFIDLSIGNPDTWLWDFGDGSISSLQNPTYSYQEPGIYNIKLISGSNGCYDSILINNYIEIFEPKALFIDSFNCDNHFSVDFWNLSLGADNYLWDFGDGTTSNLQNPTHVFSSRGTYNVSLSVVNAITECTDTFYKQVVITKPEANFDYLLSNWHGYQDSVGCVPHQVYLSNMSQDCHYYKVIWSDGYVGYGRTDHTFTSDGIFDVTLIVTDIHLCRDTMKYNNMFRINDITADFEINNALGCDSMFVEFNNLSGVTSDVYWDFGDGGNSTDNNPQYIYYNEGLYDVILYAESVDGCKDTLERIEYIQFQHPTADFTTSFQEVCPGDDIEFYNTSSGSILHSNWSFGDNTQSFQYSPTHHYNSNGVYNIELTVVDSFGCSNTLLLNNYIEVLKPNADFTANSLTSDCPPLISTFNNLSSSDVLFYEWDFGDGTQSILRNPSHVFNNSGTFDVSLIVENIYGCKDTLIQSGLVNVYGPSGEFTISDTIICKGDTINFNSIVQNTSYYLWNFGNGVVSTDSSISYVYSNDGLYYPTLIISNSSGCQLVLSNDTINVKSINIDAGFDTHICLGENVQLVPTGDINQIYWTPSISLNNPNIVSPIASPNNNTTYFIHNTDGLCYVKDSVYIEVSHDIPLASFTTINHCENDITQFSASSGLNTNNILYSWSFGGNQQIDSIQLSVGHNMIELIVENIDNSCTDTTSQYIEIFALPSALFTTNQVCLGEKMFFNGVSSDSIISWFYNFNDSSGISYLKNPEYIYHNDGVYHPVLTVVSNNGCVNDFSFPVHVNEIPIADFIFENNCQYDSNTFTNTSTIGLGSIDLVKWDFGDGSTLGTNNIENHYYEYPGLYTVNMVIESQSGCVDSIKKLTEVYEVPIVDFSTSHHCLGDNTWFFDESLINNGTIIDWKWELGDNIVLEDYKNMSYIYDEAGHYAVKLKVTSNHGCYSQSDKNITIYNPPIASFRIEDEELCLGEEISIKDLSDGLGANIIEWKWNFGDGNIIPREHPKYSYSYKGEFDISLFVMTDEGCKNDTVIYSSVRVHDFPKVEFQASKLFTTELEPEIKFYNMSEEYDFISWDFDNGKISYEENPIVNFHEVREYNVMLIASNNAGCENNLIKKITISPENTLYIPNTFTPNGDGINDEFIIMGNNISDIYLSIFNKWGGLVFESRDINYGWNGLSKNNDICHNGTYLYHVIVHDYKGMESVYTGEINVIR